MPGLVWVGCGQWASRFLFVTPWRAPQERANCKRERKKKKKGKKKRTNRSRCAAVLTLNPQGALHGAEREKEGKKKKKNKHGNLPTKRRLGPSRGLPPADYAFVVAEKGGEGGRREKKKKKTRLGISQSS